MYTTQRFDDPPGCRLPALPQQLSFGQNEDSATPSWVWWATGISAAVLVGYVLLAPSVDRYSRARSSDKAAAAGRAAAKRRQDKLAAHKAGGGTIYYVYAHKDSGCSRVGMAAEAFTKAEAEKIKREFAPIWYCPKITTRKPSWW
jgi:hypothetical protein